MDNIGRMHRTTPYLKFFCRIADQFKEKLPVNNKLQYSVLMSVYHKENAFFLKEAMNSIWNQTVQTDDFVLVCDGPLSKDLDDEIAVMLKAHNGVLHVVRLEKNSGLGNALNEGIKHCKNELVARMDSDDISRPDRCEKQIKIFKDQPMISICSGIVEEFSSSPDKIEARRVLPEKQDDILLFAKKRNPFSHPCVMFKKSAVEAAGGYKEIYVLEDYFLWIRMMQHGSIGYNIQEPLLWMRAGSSMYKRRSGLKYVKSQRKLFHYMLESKFINRKQYYISVLSRSISSILPNIIRETLFKTFMRK